MHATHNCPIKYSAIFEPKDMYRRFTALEAIYVFFFFYFSLKENNEKRNYRYFYLFQSRKKKSIKSKGVFSKNLSKKLIELQKELVVCTSTNVNKSTIMK